MANTSLSTSTTPATHLQGDSSGTRPGASRSALSQPSLSQPSPRQPKLPHPSLWQAGQLKSVEPVIASGYQPLDEQLAGGWPAQGLAELLSDSPGIGELQLLIPAMRALSQSQDRWIVWINPPYRPCAQTLRSYGVDIDKILLIHPKTADEAVWALEKAVQSGSSAMALAWIDEQQLTVKNSRRLQLAAKRGQCLSCLFRPRAAANKSSMASLRLQLKGADNGNLQVDICKRRGGWPVQNLHIALEHAPVRQARLQKTIQEQLLLWRDQQSQPNVINHAASQPAQTGPAQPHPIQPEPLAGLATVEPHSAPLRLLH